MLGRHATHHLAIAEFIGLVVHDCCVVVGYVEYEMLPVRHYSDLHMTDSGPGLMKH